MFQNRHGFTLQGRNIIACMALVSVLAGCSAEDEAPQALAVSSRASTDNAASARLALLTETEITEARLPGELVCTFSAKGNAYLYVAGDVASKADAQGVVKLADSVVAIQAPGGFDGMLRGATFKGDQLAIEIKLTGAALGGGGGESPHYPATATYLLKDNPSRTLDGRWQCGP